MLLQLPTALRIWPASIALTAPEVHTFAMGCADWDNRIDNNRGAARNGNFNPRLDFEVFEVAWQLHLTYLAQVRGAILHATKILRAKGYSSREEYPNVVIFVPPRASEDFLHWTAALALSKQFQGTTKASDLQGQCEGYDVGYALAQLKAKWKSECELDSWAEYFSRIRGELMTYLLALHACELSCGTMEVHSKIDDDLGAFSDALASCGIHT